MARRSDIDWEAVERDYRLGILTLKQISDKFGISDSQLRAKAKKLGWERDLSKDVRSAAKAKVLKKTKEAAEAEFRNTVKESAQESAEKSAVVTFSAVDVAAEAQATIELKQRGRLNNLNAMFEKLMTQMGEVLSNTVEVRELAAKILAEDPGAAKELFKLTSLPVMMDTAKRAVELNSKLQNDERIAFGIGDDDGNKGGSLEEAVAAIEAALDGSAQH